MEENRRQGEAIRLAALEDIENEKRKKAMAMARELKNQQTLMQQISEKRAMNKHAMTPLEATLNRDLLLSIAAGESYEPTSIFD